MQTEAKQRSFQDLQDYTHNLETMYDQLRSFKHDYINILTSLSGYIDKEDMVELKDFFEGKILPTKNQITQGDYKLNQFGNIGVLEIKSLLSAKMIYTHEAGIDVTIDIPDHVPDFSMNGMKLAQQIRRFDPRGFIIFVTAYSELIYMTFQYRVEAMDFLLKDTPAETKVKIRECLLHALERHTLQTNKTHKTYTIKTGEREINIDYHDILFFETSGNIHKVILHAKDRQIEFPATMKELEHTLDESFVRCHRFFLANRNNIKEIDQKKRIIYFVNGETCLMSVRMMKRICQNS